MTLLTVDITIGNRTYALRRCVDLAVPLDFHGEQPNAYGVPPATAVPYSGDGFTLNVAAGGSCNCETLTITPHCHGTHTECVGHITRDPVSVAELPPLPFLAATLITVTPDGRAITADAIEIVKYDVDFLDALIIRTTPNDDSKLTRKWQDATTPYLTPEAVAAIRHLGVRHLLIDLPSVDPMLDGGKLAAHRAWWDVPAGSTAVPTSVLRTITELIFVPDDVPDGRYVLNLQMPSLMTDAVPSRPLLFALEVPLWD